MSGFNVIFELDEVLQPQFADMSINSIVSAVDERANSSTISATGLWVTIKFMKSAKHRSKHYNWLVRGSHGSPLVYWMCHYMRPFIIWFIFRLLSGISSSSGMDLERINIRRNVVKYYRCIGVWLTIIWTSQEKADSVQNRRLLLCPRWQGTEQRAITLSVFSKQVELLYSQ